MRVALHFLMERTIHLAFPWLGPVPACQALGTGLALSLPQAEQLSPGPHAGRCRQLDIQTEVEGTVACLWDSGRSLV